MNDKFKSLVLATFRTESGEKLLEMLKNYYLVESPVAPHSRGSEYAYFREGENNIIRLFYKIIEESKNEF